MRFNSVSHLDLKNLELKMKFLVILALIVAVNASTDGVDVFNNFKKMAVDYLKLDVTQFGAQYNCLETNLLGNHAFLVSILTDYFF